MIKSIKQYINDVCFQLSHSGVDDVIWIYIPLFVVAATILTLIITALRLVIL